MNHVAFILLVAASLVLLTEAEKPVPADCECRNYLAASKSNLQKKLDCSSEAIDAATYLPTGETYFFKGIFYWRMSGAKVDQGFPRLICDDWDGLPGSLDAALTIKDGRTIFFKDGMYWSFRGMEMDKGYPKKISEDFCDLPDNLDAAFFWRKNSFPYFFQGSKYWRQKVGEPCNQVTGGYPHPIDGSQGWGNIPYDLDAAMHWKDGKIYFFKGNKYYIYEDEKNSNVEIEKFWGGVKCSELKRRIPSSIGKGKKVPEKVPEKTG